MQTSARLQKDCVTSMGNDRNESAVHYDCMYCKYQWLMIRIFGVSSEMLQHYCVSLVHIRKHPKFFRYCNLYIIRVTEILILIMRLSIPTMKVSGNLNQNCINPVKKFYETGITVNSTSFSSEESLPRRILSARSVKRMLICEAFYLFIIYNNMSCENQYSGGFCIY